MLNVSVKTNIKEISKGLKRKQKRYLPRATKDAINATAFGLRKVYRKQAEHIFDNPTAFTVNSFQVKQATLKKWKALSLLKRREKSIWLHK